MSRDCLVRTQELDPFFKRRDRTVFEFVEASEARASIPFHMSSMSGDHLEALRTWRTRTTSSNPVEAIYGLYDMVRH